MDKTKIKRLLGKTGATPGFTLPWLSGASPSLTHPWPRWDFNGFSSILLLYSEPENCLSRISVYQHCKNAKWYMTKCEQKNLTLSNLKYAFNFPYTQCSPVQRSESPSIKQIFKSRLYLFIDRLYIIRGVQVFSARGDGQTERFASWPSYRAGGGGLTKNTLWTLTPLHSACTSPVE